MTHARHDFQITNTMWHKAYQPMSSRHSTPGRHLSHWWRHRWRHSPVVPGGGRPWWRWSGCPWWRPWSRLVLRASCNRSGPPAAGTRRLPGLSEGEHKYGRVISSTLNFTHFRLFLLMPPFFYQNCTFITQTIWPWLEDCERATRRNRLQLWWTLIVVQLWWWTNLT